MDQEIVAKSVHGRYYDLVEWNTGVEKRKGEEEKEGERERGRKDEGREREKNTKYTCVYNGSTSCTYMYC